jgi:vancomycin resistance protein VanW
VNRPKSLRDVLDHGVRRLGLQAARLAAWTIVPGSWPRPRRHDPGRDGPLDALVQAVRVPFGPRDGQGEPSLEVGKRANVGRAALAFDGLLVTPERPLSFWRALGRATERRGYTWGRELRGGCVVPAIAGGICLLSNALFEAAVRAGWRVHERHGHSLEGVAPMAGTIPLDATVAWPDVDLVIAPVHAPARLSVRVEDDALCVAIFAARPSEGQVDLWHDELVVERAGERRRSIRVWRRHLDRGGTVLMTEEIARSDRRILQADEIGKTCLSCGEVSCRDRPVRETLVALRVLDKKG